MLLIRKNLLLKETDLVDCKAENRSGPLAELKPDGPHQDPRRG